jgi:hypothetical protein
VPANPPLTRQANTEEEQAWRYPCTARSKGEEGLPQPEPPGDCPCRALPAALLTSLLTLGPSTVGAGSIPLRSARWVTPIKLAPVTTRHSPGVTLEYGHPCVAEAITRLRKLVHIFGGRGFVLVQYRTPYTATEEYCPNGVLFFLPETEALKDPR